MTGASGRRILDPVSDLPLVLPLETSRQLAASLDREGKIGRALEGLGPIGGCDVVVVGGGPAEIARLTTAGARITSVDAIPSDGAAALRDESADAIVTAWAGFRGVDASALAEADRILRPGGRLLVVHDYGRDDVSRLRGDLVEYGAWSRKNGPYLTNGFKMRVLHCFWTFDTIEAARAFLGEAFGADGEAMGAALKRPRLSWNVAVYHRTKGGESAAASEVADAADAAEVGDTPHTLSPAAATAGFAAKSATTASS
ncbi:MAG: ubiE/COQ5 methyltransferase family [Chloroflexota bacterium]|nr:ubiE/COQ5 methyltransferase family [Chloroflexota bacterium]